MKDFERCIYIRYQDLKQKLSAVEARQIKFPSFELEKEIISIRASLKELIFLTNLLHEFQNGISSKLITD